MDRNQILVVLMVAAPLAVVLIVALLKGYSISIRRAKDDDKDE